QHLTGIIPRRISVVLQLVSVHTERIRSVLSGGRKTVSGNTRGLIRSGLLQSGFLRVGQRVSFAIDNLTQSGDLSLGSLPLTVGRVVLLQVPIKRTIHAVNRVTLTNDVTLQILKRDTELLGHVNSRLGILEKRPEPVVLISRQGVVDALHPRIVTI